MNGSEIENNLRWVARSYIIVDVELTEFFLVSFEGFFLLTRDYISYAELRQVEVEGRHGLPERR